MIRVAVEVREGAALFRVAVQAESISRAVSLVKGHHPDREVRVVFPICPEDFFLEDPKKTGAGPDEGRQLRALRGPLTKVR